MAANEICIAELTEYDADTLLAFGDALYGETEAALVEAARQVGDGAEDWRAVWQAAGKSSMPSRV